MEYKGKNCPRITCNAVAIIFTELYIKWLWFLGCSSKMMIYPGVFFFFSKILIFWAKNWVKDTNGPKQLVMLSTSYFCELNIRWFLVHRCKIMISPGIFFWFLGQKKNFFFLVFGPENVEKTKRGLNSLYWWVDHFLVTISHMSMLFGTLMQNDEICRSLS